MRKPSPTISVTHGRYTIRARSTADGWQARAFLTGARQGWGQQAEAFAPSQQAVLAEIQGLLDAMDRDRRDQRRHDGDMDFHVPGQAEYAAALAVAVFNKPQQAMLGAHAKAGKSGLTAAEIAAAGGYSDHSSGNLHYGKAGRSLAERLGIDVPLGRDGKPLPTAVLGRWLPAESRWVMYPELRKALAASRA